MSSVSALFFPGGNWRVAHALNVDVAGLLRLSSPRLVTEMLFHVMRQQPMALHARRLLVLKVSDSFRLAAGATILSQQILMHYQYASARGHLSRVFSLSHVFSRWLRDLQPAEQGFLFVDVGAADPTSGISREPIRRPRAP